MRPESGWKRRARRRRQRRDRELGRPADGVERHVKRDLPPRGRDCSKTRVAGRGRARTVVFALCDYDAAGRRAARSVEGGSTFTTAPVDFTLLAVTEQQIELWDLPTPPPRPASTSRLRPSCASMPPGPTISSWCQMRARASSTETRGVRSRSSSRASVRSSDGCSIAERDGERRSAACARREPRSTSLDRSLLDTLEPVDVVTTWRFSPAAGRPAARERSPPPRERSASAGARERVPASSLTEHRIDPSAPARRPARTARGYLTGWCARHAGGEVVGVPPQGAASPGLAPHLPAGARNPGGRLGHVRRCRSLIDEEDALPAPVGARTDPLAMTGPSYFSDLMVNRQRLLWTLATRRQLERWEPLVAASCVPIWTAVRSTERPYGRRRRSITLRSLPHAISSRRLTRLRRASRSTRFCVQS